MISLHKVKEWKKPIILLFSLSSAHIGSFVYLAAINVLVYKVTDGSAAAVAGLWVISPIINIITKLWTGSFIDYRSKKKIVMITYVLRALLIVTMFFATNITSLYLILIVVSVGQSFFVPASITYTTMIVPYEKRKRFNTFRSVTSSSAFIIGPAIAGVLIFLTSVEVTLLLTSLFFVIAAVFICFLPDVDKKKTEIPRLTVNRVKEDFISVFTFLKKEKYVSFVYLGYLSLMIIAYIMDAQEVAFIQTVVGLSETDYSFLLSITGIGSVAGAFVLTIIANRLSIRSMIACGMFMMAIGYVFYSLSSSFTAVMSSFILLGFFNSFLNAGALTFYQNNIPVEMMGRVTSIFQLLQSMLQVSYLSVIMLMTNLIPLKNIIISLSLLLFVFTCFYVLVIFRHSFQRYFTEKSEGVSVDE
ncbi:MFS transporter [Cytobacillus stercorigallinarum]|uniref:MFS transporter n=1 Tax=Cytobacillus stercorigallinarum TaxID=2762240 RepID=UPI001CD8A25E|nr:MFS transporter [Cytobacillus stercorigallinarum]